MKHTVAEFKEAAGKDIGFMLVHSPFSECCGVEEIGNFSLGDIRHCITKTVKGAKEDYYGVDVLFGNLHVNTRYSIFVTALCRAIKNALGNGTSMVVATTTQHQKEAVAALKKCGFKVVGKNTNGKWGNEVSLWLYKRSYE